MSDADDTTAVPWMGSVSPVSTVTTGVCGTAAMTTLKLSRVVALPPLAAPPSSPTVTRMTALPLTCGVGVKVRVALAPGLAYPTAIAGIRSGRDDTAATPTTWPDSFAGPALRPVRVTTCCGASSLSARSAGWSARGGSFTGSTVTVKVRVTVPVGKPSSLTVTVTVAVPKASGTGAMRRVAVAAGLA